MNLYSSFLEKFTTKKKLVFDNSIYSYKNFKDNVDWVSFFLNKFKHKRKILVLIDSSYHLGVFLLSVAKSGKTIIPINKDLKENQILEQILYTSPDIIIYSKNFKRIASKAKKSLLICEDDIFNDISKKKIKNDKTISTVNHLNNDFIITFSSGTTSKPKPIIFTQKIKIERYKHIKKLYNIKKKDVIFTSSPLDHSLGQRLFFLAILTGCKLVYLNKYDLKKWKKVIKKNKVSFAILPSNYLKLLKKDILNKSIKVKKVVSAAADIGRSDKLALRGKINFNEMYGASEIGTITNLKKNSPTSKIGSVGKLIGDAKVKIYDENLKTLALNKVGEIGCKTKLQFKGYFKNKKLTEKSQKNGFFLTGDLGYLDKDNYLYFVSRKKDVIISSGLNIYPVDIEKEINEHKNIKESAVVGLKDKFFGEVSFAVCVLKKNEKNFEIKIRNYLQKRLANFQQPLGYSFVKEIPKNSLGKIVKKDLKEIYNKKNLDLSKNIRLLLS